MTYNEHIADNQILVASTTDEDALGDVHAPALNTDSCVDFPQWLSDELASLEIKHNSFVTRNSLQRYIKGQPGNSRNQR